MNDKRQGVLLEWMLDKIEKNGRVDGSSFFCVFECEVQVAAHDDFRLLRPESGC